MHEVGTVARVSVDKDSGQQEGKPGVSDPLSLGAVGLMWEALLHVSRSTSYNVSCSWYHWLGIRKDQSNVLGDLLENHCINFAEGAFPDCRHNPANAGQ